MTTKDNRGKRLLMHIRAFNIGGCALHLIAKDKWTFPYIVKKMRTNAIPIFYVAFNEPDWPHFFEKFVKH